MNAPFGRTRVLSPANLKMCDRTKSRNPTFQVLIGSQEPPRIGVVPVIKLINRPNWGLLLGECPAKCNEARSGLNRSE